MSPGVAAVVAWPVEGEMAREGAYAARGPTGPSGCVCAP